MRRRLTVVLMTVDDDDYSGGDGDGNDGAVPMDCKGHDDHVAYPASTDVKDILVSYSCLLHPSCSLAASMKAVTA